MNEKSDKIKILIIICILVLIIIAVVAIFIYLVHNSNPTVPSGNIVNNVSSNETTNEENTNTEGEKNETSSNNNTITNEEENHQTLKVATDLNSYFFLKEVLTKYYKSNNMENADVLIDKDVVNELGVNSSNYRNLNDFDSPIFRIDEILKQEIDDNIYIYIVKNKIGKDKLDVKDNLLWVKQDVNNKTFSIYPYNYLKNKNYLNFKEGDGLSWQSEQTIEKKNINQYTFDNSVDSQDCMKDLFARYKFDLLLDEEHLYNLLDENYKESKYNNINELKQYIADNKNDLYLDNVEEYKITNYENYIEYKATCSNTRSYVFEVKNMMNYKLMLDSYKVIRNEEDYNSYMPQAQAKYCVKRIMQAINYKDYEFVYEKLNQIQKNNYYKDFNSFKKYLSKNFFEENNYEIDEDYLIISENSVYQFDITVTDATGNDFSYKKLTMAVTLKDNDFEISITNQQ